MVNSTNWYVPNEGTNMPGSHTYGGGGGNAGVVQYRSPLDQARAGDGQVPYAQYPDGYLGSLSQDRRQDKLMDAVQSQLNKKSYQRGVHKGEKIERDDYFWPQDFDPMRRIKAESRFTNVVNNGYTMDVKRFAPTGNPVERLAHLGKLGGLKSPEDENVYKSYGVSMAKNPVVPQDPDRAARLQKMLPQYARTM